MTERSPAAGDAGAAGGTAAGDAGSGADDPDRGVADPLVVVDGLRTYYESERLFGGSAVKAVDGVSFEVGRGETFGVVGESGCGKTTLGRSLLRLEEPDAGSVRVDGTEVTELRGRELTAWRRDAQMVYQDPTASINDRMTVGEIVREPLDVHDEGTPRERRERVRELLARVGLRQEHYHRYPHQFSGGQRQRVGIARALALEPEFVVLDEPVSALDVSVQAKILNLLADLQDDLGLTYLLIAHDLSVVRHVCDRVAVMYLGKLMEVGPTEALFESPANPYTRSLLSAIPRPDPGADADRIRLRGTPPNPRYPPDGCVFSTRCPFKIHPDDGAALSPAAWDRVERFRAVLRERDRAGVGPLEWLRRVLGRDTRFGPVEEVVAELFDPVELPADVRATLDAAAELAADGEPGGSRRRSTVPVTSTRRPSTRAGTAGRAGVTATSRSTTTPGRPRRRPAPTRPAVGTRAPTGRETAPAVGEPKGFAVGRRWASMSDDSGPVAVARSRSPLLRSAAERFRATEPFAGLTVGVSAPLTPHTALFVDVLAAGGGTVLVAGESGSTHPEVVAWLADRDGVTPLSDARDDPEALAAARDDLLSREPDLLADDGAYLLSRVHDEFPGVADGVVGACEQTTGGVTRVREMDDAGVLRFPVYDVNGTPMKRQFDNVHGTAESSLTALTSLTDAMVAGSTAVVAGYGNCGRGLAEKLRALGARTTVTEVDPRKALAALADGHDVAPMAEAVEGAEFVLTATGRYRVLAAEHLDALADGAVLASVGSGIEMAVDALADRADAVDEPEPGVERYRLPDGRRVTLLTGGRVVNLAAPGSDGNPGPVMDTTFAVMARGLAALADGTDLPPGLHPVPDRLDRAVAEQKLAAMDVAIDEPSEAQRAYHRDWATHDTADGG